MLFYDLFTNMVMLMSKSKLTEADPTVNTDLKVKKNGCKSVLSNFLTWQGLFKLLITELKASLRKLEHENADLKFLNNQYVHKVKQLEKESKQKSDRILQLQEKNFQAVVQTPGEDAEF